MKSRASPPPQRLRLESAAMDADIHIAPDSMAALRAGRADRGGAGPPAFRGMSGQGAPLEERTGPLARIWKRRTTPRATDALKAKVLRPTSQAELFSAAATSIIARRAGQAPEPAAAYEDLLRREADGDGFHLVDTTMMYAPRSGGVKRYLHAKHAWLQRAQPDRQRREPEPVEAQGGVARRILEEDP